ncbi:hypothetical protein PT285_11255 [Lactobacillus sp. ESL0791]|uniref:hypothetical protein n=1 Tax=Lactobacillus sp. ESL0791 TaxID=2983234 RepID=UPI0023FA3302|nr:hypothetical protein [Lactobacillus sp. ESL0791]MDF7639979.1 hypothetical protein [Lactobacillus sp. ESL0791]
MSSQGDVYLPAALIVLGKLSVLFSQIGVLLILKIIHSFSIIFEFIRFNLNVHFKEGGMNG